MLPHLQGKVMTHLAPQRKEDQNQIPHCKESMLLLRSNEVLHPFACRVGRAVVWAAGVGIKIVGAEARMKPLNRAIASTSLTKSSWVEMKIYLKLLIRARICGLIAHQCASSKSTQATRRTSSIGRSKLMRIICRSQRFHRGWKVFGRLCSVRMADKKS